ncbi:MAG: DinB family protein [Janthinobacterium lividum]
MAPDDQVSAIEPDDKDWTWVLERRCEECGFEAAGVAREQLAERYFVAGEEWVQILRSSPAVETRPAPTTWSPLEYGAHVRDVLGMTLQRVELMLTADDPVFANWDQDETAQAERYGEQDPERVAEDLEAAAQRLVGLIAEIEPAACERRGTRSNGSAFTVTTLLQYGLHDVVHHLWDVTGQQDGTSSLQLA